MNKKGHTPAGGPDPTASQPPVPPVEPDPDHAPASPPGRDGWSRDELLQVSEEVAAAFPAGDTHTGLVLMDVDPQHLHAYWNVTPEDLAAARQGTTGPQELVLRVLEGDPTAPGEPAFELEVHGLNSHRLVDLWSEGGPYVAELGLRGPRGFTLLARSDAAAPPREGPPTAPAPAPPPSVPPPPTSLGPGPGRGEPEPGTDFPETGPGEPHPRAETVTSEPLALGPDGPPETGATGDPDRGRLDPTLVADTADLAAAFPATGSGEAPPVADEAPAPVSVDLDAPSALPEADAPLSLQGYGPPSPGADPVSLGGVPGPHEAAALEQAQVAYSSSALAGEHPELEVHVELHVYGRARPGARLELFGRRVKLRPDGSFSIRRPLPQGAVVLPLDYFPEGGHGEDDHD